MRTVLILIVFLSLGGVSAAQDATSADSLQLKRYYQRAQELIASYQFDKALEELSTCYIKEPHNVDYLLKIAYCHSQSGRYPDAKMFYNEALKVDSLNTNALSSLGGIYEREYNYPKAKQYFELLIGIDSTNSYYFKRNGFLAIRLKDGIGAVQNFLKAHQLNGGDIEVIHQLASIYLAMGELDYAEEMLTKGLSTDPRNIKLLQARARLHHKRKEHPLVIETIEQTMAQGDTSEYYQMMLGVAYLHTDSLERSIYHLKDIIRREEDTEHTHHYLGLAYRTKGVLDTAIIHFEEAIEKGISEKMGDYYRGLASIYDQKGALKTAINHYEEGLNYSADAESLFHLARACDQYYKDKKIAMRYFQQYLSSNDGKYREYAEQRLTQLKEIVHFQN